MSHVYRQIVSKATFNNNNQSFIDRMLTIAKIYTGIIQKTKQSETTHNQILLKTGKANQAEWYSSRMIGLVGLRENDETK